MVEGPVLLHKDHDVLDVLDRPGADSRGDRGGPRDAGRQCGGRDGAARNLEEPPAIDGALPSHAPMSALSSEHKVTYSQSARGTLAALDLVDPGEQSLRFLTEVQCSDPRREGRGKPRRGGSGGQGA